jgi:hypothetical protein
VIAVRIEMEALAAAFKKTARADRLLITAFGECWNFRADKVRLAIKAWAGADVSIDRGGNLVFRRGRGGLKLYPGTAAAKVTKRNGYRKVTTARSILPMRPATLVVAETAVAC